MKHDVRILYVIDGSVYGGGERVFLQLLNAFKRKMVIYVAASPYGRFRHEVESIGLPFHAIKMTPSFSPFPSAKIAYIIKKENIHLVHSQGARVDFFSRLGCFLCGNARHVSTIAMPVEGFDVSSAKKMIYSFLDGVLRGQVSRFIVVSESLKHMMVERRGLLPERVVCIHNGIELERYRPSCSRKRRIVKKSIGLSEDALILGAVGRLVWQKGFEYLIRAMPIIVSQIPKSFLLIVGDGPLRSRLELMAASLDVAGHVKFLGFRSDIENLLQGFDLLVVPSIVEGLPMIVLEAMACGLPVIGTRIGGILEQIKADQEGILVPPGEPEPIAVAVMRLLNDPDLRQRLGDGARRGVERRFSVRKMVRETEQVYQSLL